MIAMMGGSYNPYGSYGPYGPYGPPDHQWHQLASLFVLLAGPVLLGLFSAGVRCCQQWTRRSPSASSADTAQVTDASAGTSTLSPPTGSSALPRASADGAAGADSAVPAVAPVRASDAERDRTTHTLSDAVAVGRLSLDEARERIGAALVARHRNELDDLVADLPTEASGSPHGLRHGGMAWVRGPAIAALAAMAVFAAVVTQAVAGVWAMWPVAVAAVGLFVYSAEARRLSARRPVGDPRRGVLGQPSDGRPAERARPSEKGRP